VTTVILLGTGAVAGNHVAFALSTDLNEVGTESMDNDVEANNSPREADNLGDNLVNKKVSSRSSHSSSEEPRDMRRIGWVQ
jgi:hypothetical protein